MTRTPRDYPETMVSSESGRQMVRGDKLVTFNVDGHRFQDPSARMVVFPR